MHNSAPLIDWKTKLFVSSFFCFRLLFCIVVVFFFCFFAYMHFLGVHICVSAPGWHVSVQYTGSTHAPDTKCACVCGSSACWSVFVSLKNVLWSKYFSSGDKHTSVSRAADYIWWWRKLFFFLHPPITALIPSFSCIFHSRCKCRHGHIDSISNSTWSALLFPEPLCTYVTFRAITE